MTTEKELFKAAVKAALDQTIKTLGQAVVHRDALADACAKVAQGIKKGELAVIMACQGAGKTATKGRADQQEGEELL